MKSRALPCYTSAPWWTRSTSPGNSISTAASPPGFQRTTIVGVNGRIPFQDREVRIVQLARGRSPERDVGHRSTDRPLGMPDRNGDRAGHAHAPRGGPGGRDLPPAGAQHRLGAHGNRHARQDERRSPAARGSRSGVRRASPTSAADLPRSDAPVEPARLRAELQRRGVTTAAFTTRTTEVTRILRKTRFQPVRTAIAEGQVVYGVNLVGFRDLLRWPTQTDTAFSREISDRVRVIACLPRCPTSCTQTPRARRWRPPTGTRSESTAPVTATPSSCGVDRRRTPRRAPGRSSSGRARPR